MEYMELGGSEGGGVGRPTSSFRSQSAGGMLVSLLCRAGILALGYLPGRLSIGPE